MKKAVEQDLGILERNLTSARGRLHEAEQAREVALADVQAQEGAIQYARSLLERLEAEAEAEQHGAITPERLSRCISTGESLPEHAIAIATANGEGKP